MSYTIKATIHRNARHDKRTDVVAHVTINCADAATFVQMREQVPVVLECNAHIDTFVNVFGVRVRADGCCLRSFAEQAFRLSDELRQAEDEVLPRVITRD
jgi:hypothetical protein